MNTWCPTTTLWCPWETHDICFYCICIVDITFQATFQAVWHDIFAVWHDKMITVFSLFLTLRIKKAIFVATPVRHLYKCLLHTENKIHAKLHSFASCRFVLDRNSFFLLSTSITASLHHIFVNLAHFALHLMCNTNSCNQPEMFKGPR